MNNLRHKTLFRVIFLFGILGMMILPTPNLFAQGTPTMPVQMDGDEVEYSIEDNKLYARGNVVITRGETKLTCDNVVFSRGTNIAVAEGNVVLEMEQGTIAGEKMTFDFNTMKGEFMGAKIMAHPYYGAAEVIKKVGENEMIMENGYLTTSDFDDPEYRFKTKKITVFPGDKMVARGTKLMVGKVPVIYVPKYTQVISDKKPRVIYTPGYDKDWGAFLLQSWRYYFDENFSGTIHLDYREKKDFASGIDLTYNTKKFGEGVIKTYYMNERSLKKHWYEERLTPTIEKERFKVEWRHKWRIDETTDAILRYYKLSDSTFLKDYFERDYDREGNPNTYFLLTKTLPKGTFSFRTDARVNRFASAVERLPEITYDLPNQKLGATNFYFRSSTQYSNLTNKSASPSEIRQSTMRVNSDNELSYPMKVSFIELRPFVGGEHTYYSKTMDSSKYNVIRGRFRTGADLSTKFFRVFDVNGTFWGMEVNRLRHLVTPSVAYVYEHDPTIPTAQLDQFDGIDSLSNSHYATLSLENKLQTKRDGQSVDLLRWVVETDFRLKEDPSSGSFNNVSHDIEFRPTDWVTFFHDSSYDAQQERLTSSNIDLYLRGKNWYFDFGKRYHVNSDDQVTTEWGYKINPKWYVKVYERFDIDSGQLKEQNYSFTRDLHSWEVELNFNQTRGEGNEIWVVFRLKAFPELGFDFGTSFNKRKAGSQ